MRYAQPELSVGVESALHALARAVTRDGYRMEGSLLLTTEVTGKEHAVVWHDGAWHELVGVDDERLP